MKPVSLSAAWLETLAFIKREAELILPVTLLFVAIPIALMLHVLPAELRQMTPGAPPPNVSLPPVAVLLIPASCLVILGGVLTCYALAMKAEISLREALILGFRRVPYAFAAAFIVGVSLGVPMVVLAMVSPALASLYITAATLLFSVKFLFLNAVIIDPVNGPLEAIKVSWKLTKGNTGRILLMVVAITIPIMLAQVASEILFGLLGFALGGTDGARQASDLAGSVVLALGQMFMIILTTRLYQQLSAD